MRCRYDTVHAFLLTIQPIDANFPTISWFRNPLFFTYLPTVPIFVLPPDKYCNGVNPMQTESSLPLLKLPISAQPEAI